MSAYYNEHDPFAAAWLRELIRAGEIAPGEVDERSIDDVQPADLVGYRQCHFFAGIGGWSLALRLAGWPDDRPIWTGSCPCQPFSSAGKGDGFTDPRHLWPSWFRLIRECRPDVIAGEQVESAVRHGWLDLVFDDLEGLAYACGAVDLPSSSIGTPNIRQRLWWVADADRRGSAAWREGCAADRHGQTVDADCRAGGLADADGGDACDGVLQPSGRHGGQPTRAAATERMADAARGGLQADGGTPGHAGHVDECGPVDWLGDTLSARLEGHARDGAGRGESGRLDANQTGSVAATSGAGWPLPSHFGGRPVDWLLCRDGKWRPVESGTFPLAHELPARVGRLRGYGNAINPEVAAEVIRAYMEIA